MTEDEVQALSALRFDWAMTPDDVWSAHPEHVPELHLEVGRRILGGVADAKRSAAGKPAGGSPIGLVIQGSKGSGKTHLLGWVREQVQQEGGYFFLVGLSDGETFWSNAVEAILDGLWRTGDGEHTQLQVLLRRLGSGAWPRAPVIRVVRVCRTPRGRWSCSRPPIPSSRTSPRTTSCSPVTSTR